MDNVDSQTGIHFGVIATNEISGESFENIVNCGDDMEYLAAVAEKKAEIKTALENALSAIDGVDDNIDYESLTESAFKECFPDGLENVESSSYRYAFDGYKIETNDRGYLVVVESPYYTFTRYCSPCYPNAGDLGTPNVHGIKTYCLNSDWFDESRPCPYPVYSCANGELVYEPDVDEEE